jgi:hypothetical protein
LQEFSYWSKFNIICKNTPPGILKKKKWYFGNFDKI